MSKSPTTALRRISLLALLTLLALASCGDDKAKIADATPCHINSDCKDPLVCGLGNCHTACDSTRDCNETLGEHCLVTSGDAHVCASPADQKCTYNSECKAKDPLLICARDLHCRSECQTGDDCAKSQVCVKPDLLCADQNELTDGMLADLGGPGRDGKDGDKPGGGGAGNTPSEGGAGNMPVDGHAGGQSGPGAGADSGSGASAGDAGLAGAGATNKCPRGSGDCDDNPDDCETDLSLVTTCGACDVACTSTHATVGCDAERLECAFQTPTGAPRCDSGYADCDEDAATGCEIELSTDVTNCGRCGRSCGTAACSAAACGRELVIKPTGGGNDTYYVYVQQFGDWLVYAYEAPYNGVYGEIRTIQLPLTQTGTAGNLIQTFAPGAPQPRGFTADSSKVYFATTVAPYSVWSKPLDGSGSATRVFDAPAVATSLLLNATAFYFAAGGSFYTIAKSPGTANPVAIPGLGGRGPILQTLLVSGQLVWFETVGSAYQLFRAPIAGGAPVLLEADAGTVAPDRARVITDGAYLYYNRFFGGDLRRVPVTGTAADVQTVFQTSNPVSPAVDDTFIYFSNYNGPPKRVRKDGSDPFTVENAVDNFGSYETLTQFVADGFLYTLQSSPVIGEPAGELFRHSVR